MVVFSIALVVALAAISGFYVRLHHRHAGLARELASTRTECGSLQHACEHMKQREAFQNETVSRLSHEMRIPLTSIRGALGLLSSGVLAEQGDRAGHMLRVAHNNTERLVRLVNEILDLERLESGEAPLSLSPCNIFELLQQAVDTMEAMAAAEDVLLVLDAPHSAEQFIVDANSDRMLQVFGNLLSNAVKFSPPFAQVHVGALAKDDTLTIRVEDRGRGVPADKLEAIFERYRQVEPSDEHIKHGAGLGLAICRSIIAKHHGTIHAQRNDSVIPGVAGTTMVIRLPLVQRNVIASSARQDMVA